MTLTRPEVDTDDRRSMGIARKRRIHLRVGGRCWLCTKPVDLTGPDVIYDHRGTLFITGSDADEAIWPIHTEPCNRLKTAADLHRIAKTKRQRKMAEPRKPSQIKSRPFPVGGPKRPFPSRPFQKRVSP